MTNKNKTPHKPFAKPFWKMIGGITLSFFILFAGIEVIETLNSQQLCTDRALDCIGLDVASNTDFSDRTTPELDVVGGAELNIKNNSTGKSYFVPLKTEREIKSFLEHTPPDLEVCAVDTLSSAVANIAGVDVTGCDDESESCEITVITGQQCRVKTGYTGKKLVRQAVWIDGTPFDWEGTNLNGNGLWNNLDGPSNYLFRGKSNTIGDGSNQRDNCGPSGGHNHNAKMYRPDSDGKWRKYWCSKTDCFNGCDYQWKPAYEFFPVPSYTYVVVDDDQYRSSSYGYECTHVEYQFTGTTSLNYCYGVAGDDEADAECDMVIDVPCNTYNYWGPAGQTPTPVGSCTFAGTVGSKQAICFKNCAAQSTDNCTSYDSNCELYDDGSESYNFSPSCGFEWVVSDWGIDINGTPQTNYECTLRDNPYRRHPSQGEKIVQERREVQCKALPPNDALPISDDSCVIANKPVSTQTCGAEDPKYYWKLDDDYSGCTAECKLPQDPTCSPSASGTEYKTSSCYQVIGNTNTLTSQLGACISAAGTPSIESRSCSKQCLCYN